MLARSATWTIYLMFSCMDSVQVCNLYCGCPAWILYRTATWTMGLMHEICLGLQLEPWVSSMNVIQVCNLNQRPPAWHLPRSGTSTVSLQNEFYIGLQHEPWVSCMNSGSAANGCTCVRSVYTWFLILFFLGGSWKESPNKEWFLFLLCVKATSVAQWNPL